MLIGADTTSTGSIVLGIALAILLILGFRWLRREHGDAWYIGFPLTVPLFPLLLLAAGLGPAFLKAKAVRVCVIDPSSGNTYEQYTLVGTTEVPLRQGGTAKIAPPGSANYAIVNNSARAYVLRRVIYSSFVVPGMGPKIVETIPPGGVAYSEDKLIDLGGAPGHVQGQVASTQSRLELIPEQDAR